MQDKDIGTLLRQSYKNKQVRAPPSWGYMREEGRPIRGLEGGGDRLERYGLKPSASFFLPILPSFLRRVYKPTEQVLKSTSPHPATLNTTTTNIMSSLKVVSWLHLVSFHNS
jgi:hypothetical protein